MKKWTRSGTEGFIVLLITAIILLLMWIGVKESQLQRANHLTECLKQCYPDEVDVDTSRFKCYCITSER